MTLPVGAATSSPANVRACRDGGPVHWPSPSRERDLAAGPLVVIEGNGRLTVTRVRADLYVWKLPVVVRAGRRVTVTIDPRDRRVAALAAGPMTRRLTDGRARVRYESCPGERGSATGWAGALLTTRRRACVRLVAQAAGDAVRRVVLPLGRQCRS